MRSQLIVAPDAAPPGEPGAPDPQAPSLPALGPALADVAREGFALVPDALPEPWRRRMLREVAGHSFWAMPETVGRTRQRADQLVARLGGGAHPVTDAVGRALAGAARAAAPAGAGLDRFAPSHAMYLRYAGPDDGMGAHRDAMTYLLLVCVLTLRGTARFSVLAGPGEEPKATWTTAPGDLCLLRGPGFAGEPDGRPWHRVEGPDREERVSVVFRMSGRPPAAGAAARR